MKKLSLLLATLCLLTACTAQMVDLTGTDEEPPPEKPETEEFFFTVDMVVWGDSAQADDGTPLAEYSYQLPEMTARRADGTAVLEARTESEAHAHETAGVFNGKFKDWASDNDFKEVVEAAESDLEWRRAEGLDPGGTYALGLTSSVYQTDHLVSVSADYYSYTGGAHPNTVCLGWNFDLASGAFFDVSILAEDSASFLTEVQEEIIRQARAVAAENGQKPEEFFWAEYESIIAGWSNYAVSFDDTGMTVAFSPYELACYAAGPQVFHLPYDWLRPRLSSYGCEVVGLPAEETGRES